MLQSPSPRPPSSQALAQMGEEQELADKEIRRNIVNSEFIVFYGYDVNGYLPPLPPKEKERNYSAPVWFCGNPALRQLANLRRRGPRTVLPGRTFPKRQVLLTPELRRPHTAVETRVKTILNTKYMSRPKTSEGKIESITFRLSQPSKEEPELIKPKKVQILDVEKDQDTISIASSLPGRFRTPRFIKPGPKKKTSKRHRTAAHQVLASQRGEAIPRVLTGGINDLPKRVPTKVKIYLSATTQDFVAEREVLHSLAYPELRDFCARQGLEFQVVDFPSHPEDSINIEQQLEALESCREQSYGPYFVSLVGDLSGPPVLPASLPEEDYDLFCYVADHHNMPHAELLATFYLEDENSDPHVYLLQMDEVRGLAFPSFCKLYSNILLVAKHTGKITENTKEFYDLKSATETEIKKGIFDHKDVAALSSLAFIRSFTKFNTESDAAEIYTDMLDDGVNINETAKERREALVLRLKNRLQEGVNAKCYEIPWHAEGVYPLESSSPVNLDEDAPKSIAEEHASYLRRFAEDFISGVKRLMEINKQHWYIGHPVEVIFNEVLHHAHITADHYKVFSPRKDLMSQVEALLKVTKDYESVPLVLHGKPGCGRSAIVSAVSAQGKEWLGTTTFSIVRHCGKTDKSSNITDLLVYLCLQICAIYNMEAPRISDRSSVSQMVQHFTLLLELISKHHAKKKPLLIILDDIDKLSDEDRADTLMWLPRICPPNIHIIVTLSSNSQSTMERIEHRLKTTNSCIVIDNPSQKEILGVVITYIKNSGRRITTDQISALASVCKKYQNPAFVSAMCRIALTWCSWTYVDTDLLPTNTEDALVKLKYSLMNSFGDLLADRVLCYITLFSNGISEMELHDALVSDERVLTELVQGSNEDDEQFYMMSNLANRLTKILAEIAPLLKEVHRDGKTLLCWHHPHFRDIMLRLCFEDDIEDKLELYQQTFCDLLQHEESVEKAIDGYPEPIECETIPQLLHPSSLHKLQLIPQLLSQSLSHELAIEALKEICLCKFKWLLIKLQAKTPKQVLYDFDLVEERNAEVDLIRDFLKLTQRALTLDPLTLPGQLLGCLPPLLTKDYPLVNQMLEDCLKYLEDTMIAVLVPLFPVFPSPLDSCKVKLWGIVDILCFDDSGRLAVTKNDNGYIEIWDVDNQEVAYSLGAKYNKTTPNTFCSGERLFSLEWPQANVWEIVTGSEIYKINIGSLLGGTISSLFLLCYDVKFDKIVVHTSDEEFNQTIAIVDMSKKKVLHRITQFDVKDEFFRDAAYLTSDRQNFVFVNARSQLMDDGKTTDFVKLNILNLNSGKVENQVKCGVKKFHSLLPRKDGKCIISWTDCSFDVYNIELGSHSSHMASPDSELLLHQSFLTEDNYLVALSSTDRPNNDSNQYYALWFWNTDEQAPVNLLSQSFQDPSEIPHHCLIIEELHIALLATPETAVVTIWDLPNSECLATIQAHTELLERLVRTPDPYRFYSCSSGEEVVKLWDVYNTIIQAKQAKQKINKDPTSSMVLLRRKSSGLESGILKRPGSRTKNAVPSRKAVRFAEEDHFEGDTELSVSMDLVEVSHSVKENVSFASRDDVDTGIRNSSLIASQLSLCKQISCIEFSKDSLLVVSGSECYAPVVWNAGDGCVRQVMKPFCDGDRATPWVSLGVNETCIVGLTADDTTNESYPKMYKYQVWNVESGEPMLLDAEPLYRASACALMHERDRAVLACFEDGKLGEELVFNVIMIKNHTVLHSVTFKTEAIPTTVTIADDNLYAVTNNVPEDNDKNLGTMVFKVGKEQDEEDIPDDEKEEPVTQSYHFRTGSKYKEYRSTKCVLMSNGMAISSGLNGDMQMWDVASCEYEGNLFYDTTVKETRDPNLHNYGGKRVMDLAVSDNGSYLICGISDGSAALWDLENDALCYTYTGHTLEVSQVAISWDNQLVLTSSKDLSLCVWQFATPEHPLARIFIYSVPTLLKISPDKRTVVAVGARKNEPSRMMLFNLRNTFTD